MNSLHRVLSTFLALLLLLATQNAVGAAATKTRLTDAQAISLLQTYNIVRGDPSGSLLLSERLTRAQAAALFVRSMGAESLALAARDLVPFTDAQGHWAAGEIAIAARLGLMRGDGNGIFRPNAEITYAEVLTVLLRMVEQEPTGPWDRNVIIGRAAELGILPDGITATMPAVRGKIFWALASTVSTVPLPSGKSALQERIDQQPPDLKLDQVATSTSDATQTISGIVADAARVTVNGRTATLDSATGRFSVAIDLQVGPNLILVEATDLAGNTTSSSVRVERRPTIARLEITGPSIVRAGGAVKLTVTAYDANGQLIPAEGLQASVAGDMATFDVTTSTLHAGTKTGRDSLTLRSGSASKSFAFDVVTQSARAASLMILPVNEGRAPATGKAVTVKVQVLDQSGAPITDDYWRPITLSSAGLSGISITPTTANTEGGVATFTVSSTREGAATLNASSADLDTVSTTIQFLSGNRIVLTATPSSLKPDGVVTATVRATLQDESGRTITNPTSTHIQVGITGSGSDGQVTDSILSIRPGASTSSGDDALVLAGVRPGTMVVTGAILSGHTYAVQPLTLPITGALPGVKLQVTGPTARLTPNGASGVVTVRVLDASNHLVTTGSYAFQLEVTASNRDPKINGIPEGAQVTFSDSLYTPVDDGRSPSDPLNSSLSVVGRTLNGIATVKVSYDRSGILTITPVLTSASDTAFDSTGGVGKASGSIGMARESAQLTFSGSVAGVKLTADSALGQDQPGAAVQGIRTVKVHATVVDNTGAPVPGYNGTVTLSRNGGNAVTSIVSPRSLSATNGVADFTVASNGPVGYDIYTATTGSFTSVPLTVSVRDRTAPAPTVVAIRGGRAGDPSPITGYVGPDAEFMEIELESSGGIVTGEPTNWVTAKVYRKGESTPFFTGPVLDMKGDRPVIRIPKASLQRAGRYSYEVVINNAVGDSPRSAESPVTQALNALYNPDYRLVSALYDAETGKLVIETRNLAIGGSADPSSFTLYKQDGAHLDLAAPLVQVTSFTSSSLTLKLGTLAHEVTPDAFNGLVYLTARDGWFFNNDSSLIARALTAPIQVKPMGTISHAVLEESTRHLYLYGAGFSQITTNQLALDQIALEDGTMPVRLRPSADRVDSMSDVRIGILLSTETLQAIRALTGGPVYLTANVGWMRITSGSSTYKTGAIGGQTHLLYVQVTANSAFYDRAKKQLVVSGSGFTGARLVPAKLTFQTTAASETWSPSAESTTTVESDSVIRVQLADADAVAFGAMFTGRSVYMNGDAGWLFDAAQRPAAPIPVNSVFFSVPR